MNFQNTDFNSQALSTADHHEDRHRLWQEMQEAYNAYLSTSEALTELVSECQASCKTEKDVGITALEQRAAFENYIDARLRYAEFGRDEESILTIGLRAAECDRPTDRRDRAKPLDRLLMATANVLLLAMIALTSMYWLHEEKRVHVAVRGAEQMHAALTRSERDLGESRPNLDSSTKPARADASAKPSHTDIRFKKKDKALGRDSNVRSLNRRGYYEFTLVPSTRPRRVGPVSLLIRQVDPKRKSLTLSIIAGRRIDEKQIRLNVPVWIPQGDSMVLMKLVATSIDAQHVRGYLALPADNRVELSSNGSRAGFRNRAWN